MKFNKNIIKKLNKPNIIYHYTNSKTALEYILNNKNLKLSSISKTNDPAEYNDWGYFSFSDKKIIKKTVKLYPKISRKVREETKFISFCKNSVKFNQNEDYNYKDQKIIEGLGCSKLRMWSQYGEDQKGVCLAFDLKKLEEEIKNGINKKNDYWESDEIKYKSLPLFNQKKLEIKPEKVEEFGENYVDKFIKERKKELFFTKHKDYKDENEHRIIVHDPKDELEFIDITSSLCGIILGDNFNEVYKPLVQKYVENFNDKRKIFLYKIYFRNGCISIREANENFKDLSDNGWVKSSQK